MDNSGFLSETIDHQDYEDNLSITNIFQQHKFCKKMSTPVGLAVAATTSADLVDESTETTLENEFFVWNKRIPSVSSFELQKYSPNKTELSNAFEGLSLKCTCRSGVNQKLVSDHPRRIKHLFREEHAKKFMCTLNLFSAEKQVEFNSTELELNHMQICLSRAMNQSVYKVNTVADTAIAKINMERKDMVRRITEEGSLAIANVEAQKQFVIDLRRRLQYADDETADKFGKQFDNASIRNASNLTDTVRKIQGMEHTKQFLNPYVMDFEMSPDLESITIGRLIERPTTVQIAQQQSSDESYRRKYLKRRPLLKFGGGFGRVSSIVIAYDVSTDDRNEGLVAVAAGGGGVLVFSTVNGAFILRFSGPDHERITDARNVAHLSNGNILVIDGKSKYVRVFEPHGRFLHKFGTRKLSKNIRGSKVRICSVAVDRNDIILVGDRCRKVITMHQPDGLKIQTLPTGIEPDYLAVGSKGIIAVSGGEAFEVQLINYIGQFLLRISSLPNGCSLWPKGVYFDDLSKYVYVAHYKSLGKKSIHRYNVMTGKYVDCVIKNLSGPNGIALFGHFKLVVADFGCVKTFSIEGEPEI